MLACMDIHHVQWDGKVYTEVKVYPEEPTAT